MIPGPRVWRAGALALALTVLPALVGEEPRAAAVAPADGGDLEVRVELGAGGLPIDPEPLLADEPQNRRPARGAGAPPR